MATAPHLGGFGAAAPLADDLTEALHRGRRRLMIAGGLAVVLGAVAIVVPAVASVATAIFIGWILILAGAYHVTDAFAAEDGGRRALRLVLALLTLVAGFYLVVAPLDGTFTLTVVLVIWFMATGTARIIVGIAERGVPGAWMTVANGALSLVLGILIAEKLPSSADWAIGLIVGIDLLFAGVTLMSLGRALRRLAP
jgi:uncharacterized membrane protein HdeD (DUF308 family)